MIGALPSFFKPPHSLTGRPPTEPILVGLSGGADSVSLLHMLCELRKRHPFPLYAAHVNHGIRTEDYQNEASRDEAFCKELCQDLGVELFVARLDVPALSEASGNSLETEAREARYAFFTEIMESRGIKTLVTAHNADDNLETQIFNLCRGCGIQGISGIREIRCFDPVEGAFLVRPILRGSKKEILAFCRENGLKYVTDSTNLEDDCTRNRIRHRILPQLTELFGSPEASGLRLAQYAAEDNDFMEGEARKILREKENGQITTKELCSLPPAIAKRVLSLAFREVSTATLEATHLEALLEFAHEGKCGAISLPDRITARFSGGILRFERTSQERPSSPYQIPLKIGLSVIEGTDFAVLIDQEVENKRSLSIGRDTYTLYTFAFIRNADASALTAASRREGETILDGGMHKRIKKLMCDKKLPSWERDQLPVLRADGNAVYVPFCAVADGIKADSKNFDYKISIYKKSDPKESKSHVTEY